MGQVLQKDKIGTLSETAGTITLQPSVLTIGGQQYTTGVLNVAANLGAANTRYQIYAVLSGGVISLAVSSNENSVGPAGHTVWKLVGSYYTNGRSPVAFGSFITITGVPITFNEILYTPAINPSGGGSVSVGTGGNATEWGKWSRNGKQIKCDFTMRFGSSGTSFGSGVYEVLIPGVLNHENRPQGQGAAAFDVKGHGSLFDSSAPQNYGFNFGVGETTPTDEILMLVEETASSSITIGNTVPFTFANDDIIRGFLEVQVQEWDSTPIEDL